MQNLVAAFLEEPTHDALREVLLNGTGEMATCDFKESLPKWGSLAKHLLAMANCGGGCLIFGVGEGTNHTLELRGVTEKWSEPSIRKGIEKFVPHALQEIIQSNEFEFTTDSNDASGISGRFPVLVVENDPMHAPYVSTGDSGDDIKAGVVYVRRGAMSVWANHDELQKVINRRLETGYSTRSQIDLADHVEQMKVLYRNIDKVNVTNLDFKAIADMFSVVSSAQRTPNPDYPPEDFGKFIRRMIDKKKHRIEIELDVRHLPDPVVPEGTGDE